MQSHNDCPFEWQTPAASVRVLIERAVAADLVSHLSNSAEREFGGILLGRSVQSDEEVVTHIEGFEPFVVGDGGDSHFVVSAKDRGRLQARISKRGRNEMVPVGLCRSHRRRGLYLDQRDFEIFRAYFQSPEAVFLLLRRQEGGPVTGGFFVWEGEEVRRHEPYREIAFEAEARSAPVTAKPSKAVPPSSVPSIARAAGNGAARNAGAAVAPAPAAPHPPSVEVRRATATAPSTMTAAGGDRNAALQALLAKAPDPSPGVPKWFRSAALAAGAALVLLGAFYAGRSSAPAISRAVRTQPGPATAASAPLDRPTIVPVALRIRQTGSQLEFLWNPADPAVVSASQGHILISEAGQQYEVALTAQALAEGRYSYRPDADSVSARLEVFQTDPGRDTSAKLVRPPVEPVPEPPATEPPPPARIPQAREPEALAAPPARESRSRRTKSGRQRGGADRVAAPFTPPPSASPATPGPATLPAPPVVTAESIGKPPIHFEAAAPSRPAPVSLVGIESVPPSKIRQALGRVPGIRSLAARGKPESFVAARPVKRTMPSAPADIPEGENAIVEVVVHVNEEGRVHDTSSRAGDRRLTRLARQAVTEWVFEPARVDGTPVASEVLLRFAFRSNR